MMKKYFNYIFSAKRLYYFSIPMALLWLCSNMLALTGCKKDRLFSHVDSIAAVPSQFHFLNTYSYDNALEFSVDGLPREAVKQYAFSNYYPSSSAFNLNSQQPNSKLINVYDPANSALFANLPNNNTFQFKPNTSYVVFVTNSSYDTVSSPLKVNVPTINYYPEDIYHPFDGTTGIRAFSCLAGSYGPDDIQISISPNVGAGTTALLNSNSGLIYTPVQPTTAAASYISTQGGVKKVSLLINPGSGYGYTSTPATLLTFLPVQLDNSKNYSFFAVGDMKNFSAGLQPRPRLFMVQDGVPSSLKELTLSTLSYPGNLTTTSQVTVVNDAYNINGLITVGDPNATYYQYPGLDVQLNQTRVNVSRWPIISPDGGGPNIEDINDAISIFKGSGPQNILPNRVVTYQNLTPGAYSVNVVPGHAFSPVFDQFTYNFQQGTAYTVCLLPNNTTSQKCSQMILQNDQSPAVNVFRLRFINIMGGTIQLDIHTGSPSGPVIASAITYGQQNDYINFTPSLIAQNLYVTTAGSNTALFQIGAKNNPLSIPFTGGNSGTIYLMGLLPGTPYSGDSGAFGPYVYYNQDAYINANTAIPNTQLFY
jgi:hypothetical protein